MLKLSRNQVAEIREALEEDNKRIEHLRMFGSQADAVNAKRAKNLTPTVLANRYAVSVGQIRYAAKDLL